MDSLITSSARSLAAGDPLAALGRIALRDDPPALALRGIAMAQLGDFVRAKSLLRRASRAFGPAEPVARARCVLAEAELALVSRDLRQSIQALETAWEVLELHHDRANAAHARYLLSRSLLLVGKLEASSAVLQAIDFAQLPAASRPGAWLVQAGIAMRRFEPEAAREALDEASAAAWKTGIQALIREAAQASSQLAVPAGRLLEAGVERVARFEDVASVIAAGTLVIDVHRSQVRSGKAILSLKSRPVLFALARLLGEHWPKDVPREDLISRAFGGREADESHRARLRVEIGRLRGELAALADIEATERGYALVPVTGSTIAVLLPPREDEHGEILSLLADGEAWSSSALAMALGVSARTVQRALQALVAAGKVEQFGRGRTCRWIAKQVPGFPTSLLLTAPAGGR